MLNSQFILDSLSEYVTEDDVQLRHGWFQVKMDSVIKATPGESQEEVMNKIDFILSRPYFIAEELLSNNKINESEYWSRVARFTDVFEILRQIRRKYNLPRSVILK